MYINSKTPEPPAKSVCLAHQGEDHEPAYIVGSDFARMFPTVNTDDGGAVQLMPCKHCGLIYWTSIKHGDVLY